MEIYICKSVTECENFKIPHQFAKHRQSLSWLWHQVTIPKWKFLGQKWYHKFRDMISVVKNEKTVLMFLKLGVTRVIQKWKFSYCLKYMKYGSLFLWLDCKKLLWGRAQSCDTCHPNLEIFICIHMYMSQGFHIRHQNAKSSPQICLPISIRSLNFHFWKKIWVWLWSAQHVHHFYV